MVQRVSTVAFEGIEARAVDVQVQVAPGLPAFAMVGTNDPLDRCCGQLKVLSSSF
jgi:magnesium chelatase family protein